MLRYDCRHCHENIFVVQDITHLGDIPHEWTCCGCGRVYRAEANDEGKLMVYQKGYKRSARVYDVVVPVKPESGEEP